MTGGFVKGEPCSPRLRKGPWRPGQWTHLDQQKEGLGTGDALGHGEVTGIGVDDKGVVLVLSWEGGRRVWP